MNWVSVSLSLVFSFLLTAPAFSTVVSITPYISDSAANDSVSGAFSVRGFGSPTSASISSNVPSNIVGLGLPSTYSTIASATSAPFGGPLLTNIPFVEASAHAEGGLHASGSAALRYYFSLSGPASDSIPINLDFIARTLAGRYSNGTISSLPTHSTEQSDSTFVIQVIDMQTLTVVLNSVTGCGTGPLTSYCMSDPYFTGEVSAIIKTGREYEVSLSASADAFSWTSGAQGITYMFASTYLDPYLSIDSSLANADQYSFQFSEGITNAPLPSLPTSVPEPPSWSILLSGLLLMGRSWYPQFLNRRAPMFSANN